jgi:hypothetical protein
MRFCSRVRVSQPQIKFVGKAEDRSSGSEPLDWKAKNCFLPPGGAYGNSQIRRNFLPTSKND